MGTKIRKQIYIEPEQEEFLKQRAHDTGLSEAELIRQAIDSQAQLGRSPQPDVQAWNNILAFIQKRMELGYVPTEWKWNREELYDRKVLRGH
jgi:hypothetical protein